MKIILNLQKCQAKDVSKERKSGWFLHLSTKVLPEPTGYPVENKLLTKFSSSFCLTASEYESSSFFCNSVNRSFSCNEV